MLNTKCAHFECVYMLSVCRKRRRNRKRCPYKFLSPSSINIKQLIVNGTGLQTCTGLAAGLQGHRYGYEISTLAKPVPLATGIGVGGKDNFKYK